MVADLGALLGSQGGNLTVRSPDDPTGGPVTGSVVYREQAPNGLMAGQVGLVSVPGVVSLPAVQEDPTVVRRAARRDQAVDRALAPVSAQDSSASPLSTMSGSRPRYSAICSTTTSWIRSARSSGLRERSSIGRR